MAPRKFQFLQEIAAGGFGSVYLAKLLTEDGGPQVVAVKMLHRRWSDNAEIASRMRDEARLLACLRHENIVEVLDYAVIDGRSAVVMEVLEAVDLRILLDHQIPKHALIPLAAVLQIGAAVARALDAAYNRPAPGSGGRPLRVIHRDIKPSNIMVDARGRVKVLDFGVARADFDAREARTAELAFGSLEYMPPERLFFEPESAASDVYSLGTALYELMSLEKLGKAKLRQSEQEKFLTERLADLVARHPLPADIEAEVLHSLSNMLSFDESQRPAAAEVARRLDALASRAADLGTQRLEPWARAVVQPLIEVARSRFQGGGTLIGQTLTEDPVPARAAAPQPDPDQVDEDDAALLELDDSDHDGSTLLALDADDDGLEEAETAYHTDLMTRARDELVEGVLHDPDALDDTAWTALEQQTLEALGNTTSGLPRSKPASGPWRGPDGLDTELHPPQGAGLRPRGWADERETVRVPAPELHRPTPDAPEAETVVVPLADAETVLQAPMYLVDGDAPPGPRGGNTAPPPAASSHPAIRAAAPAPRRAPSLPPAPAPDPAPLPRVRPAQPIDGGIRPAHLVASGMLMLAIGVVIGSVIAMSGVGIAAISLPAARPVAVVQPAPIPAAPHGPDVVPPLQQSGAATAPRGAGTIVFRSLLPGTRRIMARCDGASEAGVDQVRLSGARFAECTVTAVDGNRQRRTAVLTNLEPRTYLCFGDDAVDGCE